MSTSEDLKRAYRAIKHDQPEEAQAIIRPILEAEPNNAHAWWLLAYAVDDPSEVRHALTRVLEIDPNYTNAPKARDMLAKINEQFPPEPEPSGFDSPFDTGAATFGSDDFLSASPFDEPAAAETFDAYEDSFDEALTQADDDFFAAPDLFADLEEPAETAAELRSRPLRRDELQAALEPKTSLDPETRAALEEQAARRQGRGGRLFRLFLITITIPILVVVALFLLFREEDKEQKDPGELQSVEMEPGTIDDVLIATGNEVRLANLSDDSKVIVAETSAGNTLFVEMCSQPGPDLPQRAMQGMEIAARQTPTLQGQLDAVGVAIHLCGSPQYDMLYRAYVPLADAVQYANGELGEGAVGQAAFQKLWKTF